MKILESKIEKLRDPCFLEENGVFYLYGSEWLCSKNTTGRLDGGWSVPKKCVELPENNDFLEHDWAPEVHKVGDKYYMFTTYRSKATGRRGCTVFKASTPEGPFKPHSDGHFTPHDWDAIDATLFFDEKGQPWTVFVHEWVCTPDKIGRFAAAKMSPDLKTLVSEPIELFRADSFPWTDHFVTDGCWLYRTKKGSLLMLWSNFIPNGKGYAVGIARSDNGKIDGSWSDGGVLYSREKSGKYEGGHGMIFELDGKLWLSIHAPNTPVGDRKEMPIFVEITEENDTLVCKE